MKVYKGDIVLVILGKDKGVKGKVLQVYLDCNWVLVEGVNWIKKYIVILIIQWGVCLGGIVIQEVLIYVFNVMVVDFDGKFI